MKSIHNISLNNFDKDEIMIVVANGKYQAWTKYMMYDAIVQGKVLYFMDIKDTINNHVLRFLYRLYRSEKFGKYLQYIPNFFWYHYIDFSHVHNEKKVKGFIFYMAEGISTNLSYLHMLKQKYPFARFILIATGSLNIYLAFLKKNNTDINQLINFYDHVEFWDKKDAEYLSVFPYKRTYSLSVCGEYQSASETIELLFIGYSKNRLAEIVKAYDFFEANDIKCLFIVSGVEHKNQIQRQNIRYEEWLSYDICVQYMKKCKVMLEIILNGMLSSTLRVEESIAFKKKLLTNNEHIVDDEYYNSESMKLLNYDKNDIAFIQSDEIVVHPLRENISPLHSIQHYLTSKNNVEST